MEDNVGPITEYGEMEIGSYIVLEKKVIHYKYSMCHVRTWMSVLGWGVVGRDGARVGGVGSIYR